jgi:uncharacterized RDD family membrane protein YckC
MTCPLCGKASPCVHTLRNSSALVDHHADQDIFADDEQMLAQPTPMRAVAGERSTNDQAWRGEIVSRVQQHRARRRRPADPNAMELDFPADAPHSFGLESDDGPLPPVPDRFHEIVIPQNLVKPVMGKPGPPKIIRFPRTQPTYIPTVEEVMLDELEQAAPSPEAPRILEAYDAEPFESEPDEFEREELDPQEFVPQVRPSLEGQQMELLPSFSDIQLEPEESRIDHDSEVIPHPAPMPRRLVAGLVDVGIVFIATAAFALTFMEVADGIPHTSMTMVCMLAAGGIFWLMFQYIFLVYRRATPGMNFVQLELCTFDGKETTMFERQCRAAASALSGFSMGLGYAWAMVDEDRMGWHDWISRTHVRAVSEIPTLSLSKGREPYYYDDMKG